LACLCTQARGCCRATTCFLDRAVIYACDPSIGHIHV
jgi:hypothetical protein